jgi:MFS transporter, OFA family, oxalate/formate antiporter
LFVSTVVGARKIRADAPPSRRSLRDPAAAAMRVATGSWIPVFGVAVAMDIATALLALFGLKQMRAAYLGDRKSGPSAELAPAASRWR